jgi:hypothetical protein
MQDPQIESWDKFRSRIGIVAVCAQAHSTCPSLPREHLSCRLSQARDGAVVRARATVSMGAFCASGSWGIQFRGALYGAARLVLRYFWCARLWHNRLPRQHPHRRLFSEIGRRGKKLKGG